MEGAAGRRAVRREVGEAFLFTPCGDEAPMPLPGRDADGGMTET